MQLDRFHCTMDEMTYDRQELEDFFNTHKQHVMPFGEYMQYMTNDTKRDFPSQPGMNAVAVHKTEGKHLYDYEVVRKYMDRFNFDEPIDPLNLDMLHYDKGYRFHPHTDHYMNAGIMFPILPNGGMSPMRFYDREGYVPERRVNYELRGWTDEHDIAYDHVYSLEHPTLFNGLQVHGVPTVQEEFRVILRLKVTTEFFEDIVEKLKKGTFIKPE